MTTKTRLRLLDGLPYAKLITSGCHVQKGFFATRSTGYFVTDGLVPLIPRSSFNDVIFGNGRDLNSGVAPFSQVLAFLRHSTEGPFKQVDQGTPVIQEVRIFLCGTEGQQSRQNDS